jgi:hypothetical protein
MSGFFQSLAKHVYKDKAGVAESSFFTVLIFYSRSLKLSPQRKRKLCQDLKKIDNVVKGMKFRYFLLRQGCH